MHLLCVCVCADTQRKSVCDKETGGSKANDSTCKYEHDILDCVCVVDSGAARRVSGNHTLFMSS